MIVLHHTCQGFKRQAVARKPLNASTAHQGVMARKRIPLEAESEDDAEDAGPFTADTDELRAEMDKSHMPEGGEDAAVPRDSSRPAPRNQEQRTASGGDRTADRDADAGRGRREGRAYIEQQAVTMLVDKLREKGVSDAFIEDNMDTIREKARERLYGQDRR